jgi:uncharacterized membrane protein HdeD (DUF308 family)
MKIDRMGVLYLVAHLLITLGILGVYLYSLTTGHPDETSKVLLYTIVGYWFGAVGIDRIKPSGNQSTKDGSPNTTSDQAGGEKQ